MGDPKKGSPAKPGKPETAEPDFITVSKQRKGAFNKQKRIDEVFVPCKKIPDKAPPDSGDKND